MIFLTRAADLDEKPVPTSLKSVDRLDQVGTFASFLCALHCALMPLVISVLPLLGLGFLSTEPVEWLLLLCSIGFGLSSIRLGYKQHHSSRVLAIAALSIILLLSARLLAFSHASHHAEHAISWLETGLMVSGGALMMLTHFVNHKLCHALPSHRH